VVAALLIGLGTSSWLFIKEKAARQRAVAAEWQAELARANEVKLRRLAEIREKITQATVLLNDEKYDEADQLISQVLVTQPTVEGAAVFRTLGEYHAFRNQWVDAAGRFNEMLQIDQLDGWDVCTLDYLECGPALVKEGDIESYERFRQGAVARFASSSYPFADRIIKISLLLPASEKLLRDLRPMAEIAEQSFDDNTKGGDDVFLAAWRSVSLALMEYRSGNYVKSAGWAERCLNYPEHIAPRTETARVILAMSDYQLGKTSEARLELAQAREKIENQFKGQLDRGTPVQGFWFDWVFAQILLNEAISLIEGESKATQLH
jgi:hypothetical protein